MATENKMKRLVPAGAFQWPLPDEAIKDTIAAFQADGTWGHYHGRHTELLCQRLSEYHGCEHVRLCSSGTVAVELALAGLGVTAGDEVILAGYDFPGNFSCIERLGARPVIVDIDEHGSLAAEMLHEALSSHTRAVLVSHVHSGLAAMPAIRTWAERQGVAVLEDACQAPGAKINNQMAATWGDASVLSFGGSKLLTAGRGGAVLTRDAGIAQRMKVYAEPGNDAFPLSQMQAAVLVPQLVKLDMRNEVRRQRARQLWRATHDLPGLSWLGPMDEPGAEPSYYKIAWQVAGDANRRAAWISGLQAAGLQVDAGFRGFTKRSPRRCRRVKTLPRSECAAECLILLHHPVLLQEDVVLDLVVTAFQRVADMVAE